MRYSSVLFLSLLFLLSCSKKQEIDELIVDAKIYTVDSTFSTHEAMAIDQGRILAVGSAQDLRQRYTARQERSLAGLYVYPGFIDAHCHFYGYGLSLEQVALEGCASAAELVQRVQQHAASHPSTWILGRGWDQNLWPDKQFPTRTALDSLFPNTPVYLRRIDGHAALANAAALRLAQIDATTQVAGGEVVLQNGQPTGVLIDNAMALVEPHIPSTTPQQAQRALLAAQEHCFRLGLSSLHDAGLERTTVLLIDSLQQAKELKIRLYAMLSPTPENLQHFVQRGPYRTERLTVRSVKFFADGALGSRGAKLVEPYHDAHHTNGLLLTPTAELKTWYQHCLQHGYQANTHAIGDSANRLILHLYADVLAPDNDLRWRVEHAQVVQPGDIGLFGRHRIVPSVQPTHATSDMRWADQRLGPERVRTAYAYRALMEQNGWLPLGSDFPVEQINPLLGFYAAVSRQDLAHWPQGGWQMENALTRQDALRGMTIWAARAAFEEADRGSLEPGKWADYVVLPHDLLTMPLDSVPTLAVKATFVAGEQVYPKP